MNYIPKDEKIEKYLNELSEEYKELLFKALISQSKSMENLSVIDLLRLDAEIKRPLMNDYKRIQKRRNMLISVGLAYMISGVFLYVFFNIIDSPHSLDIHKLSILISIIISFMGVLAIILSFITPTKSTKHISNITKTKPLLEYEIIHKWRELEGKVIDISEDNRVKTPRSIIVFLSESHFIDDNEGKELQKLLRMRNNIAHNSDVEYSEKELKEALDKANNILSKLNKIL